jgi:endonuclease VIII
VPEGDTVWLTAHRLDQALRDAPLTISDFRIPSLATVELTGEVVTDVAARGKHILMRIASGLTVHSHLRMDGSWYVSRAGQRPRRHPDHMIRVQFGNANWLATGYRIHDLRIVATTNEDELVGHLGPDLLGADWDLDEAVRRLGAQPDRAIGEALLDQRALAGIGNLYKSEALYVERINPWSPVRDIDQLERLVTTARRLMLANRDHPAQSTTGLLSRGDEHWVYRRDGQPCRRCRTPIARADQGPAGESRSTYWCPACQPRTG